MEARATFIAEIDQAELAVRLIERGCHIKRPFGLPAREAIDQFRAAANNGEIPAYILDDFEAMAVIAIEYFRECIASGKRPN